MEVYAIGDAQNDQPMIEAYTSFAMINGDENLKASANYIVNSVSEAIKIII